MISNRIAIVRVAFVTIAMLGVIAFTASASEARTSLSQDRADKAAVIYMDDLVETYNTFYDPERPTGWVPVPFDDESFEYNAFIERYELDDCDVTGRKAECDATVFWSDGDACDLTVYERTTRRNKLTTYHEGMICDSGNDEAF